MVQFLTVLVIPDWQAARPSRIEPTERQPLISKTEEQLGNLKSIDDPVRLHREDSLRNILIRFVYKNNTTNSMHCHVWFSRKPVRI